mgnify:CR=1 FL=1
MSNSKQDVRPKKIAAITTVRNDTIFLERWVQYYGDQFGDKNIYVFIDGHDQSVPESAKKANIIFLPHIPLNRAAGDRRRAKIMSDFARGLFQLFDIVIATDVDEFLAVDPNTNQSLTEYLSTKNNYSSLSGLGLDVGQHLKLEQPIDLNLPFLSQRNFAHLFSRYTKPSIAFKPITWGSGMHRIKGKNFHIDPNLYLFHFGMIDYQLSTGKTSDSGQLNNNWAKHLSRREQLFKIISEAKAIAGDDYFAQARHYQTWHRPLYALNKPGVIPGNPVIEIPERFKKII